jgi:transcriptional regulator with XRE-family HTH domain
MHYHASAASPVFLTIRVVNLPMSVSPNPIDVHVGARLKLRRTLLGVSQEKLAESVAITFQQIQKYERGINRIGASRLYDLASVLDVSVDYFFDEMPQQVASQSPAQRSGAKQADVPDAGYDLLARRETLELVRSYYQIRDQGVRKRLFELTKAIARSSG